MNEKTYFCLIRSLFNYGAVILTPYQKGKINQLKRTQRRAQNFPEKNYINQKKAAYKQLRDLQLPTLQNRRELVRLIFQNKVISGMVPAIRPENFLREKNRRDH